MFGENAVCLASPLVAAVLNKQGKKMNHHHEWKQNLCKQKAAQWVKYNIIANKLKQTANK